MVSQGAGPTSARIRQASSTSPQTGMPACAAASEQRLVRAPPRGGDDEVGEPAVRHTRDVLGAEAHVHAEDVEDAGPLPQRGVGVGVAAVHGHHPRAALVQRVGRGEAADTEPGHDHADAAPVGAAAGQAVEPPAHAAPTTHSA